MDQTLLAAGVLVTLTGLSLFVAGPLGPVFVGLALVLAALVTGDSGDGTDTADPSERTNCPGCGTRNDADADACHHCGNDLPGPP